MNSSWAAWILGACAIAASFACSATPETPAARAILRIETIQLRFGGAPAMRSDGTGLEARALDSLGGFARMTVPDYWSIGRRRRGGEGWYRANFEAPGAPSDWAIAIDGSWASLQVFANGERLAESTSADRPAQAPLLSPSYILVPLPRSLLREGSNEIALHFASRPDEIGNLTGLAIGPSAALAEIQRNATLRRVTLPSLIALFGLSCGLLVLMLTRWSQMHGTFALGLGTTLWSAAALLGPLASGPSSLFGGVIATAAHAFPPCIAIGFSRALGMHRPRFEALLIATIVVGAATHMVVAPVWVPIVDNLWWVVNAVIGLYLLKLAVAVVRQGALPISRVLLVASVIIVGAGVIDLGSILAGRSPFGFSLFTATTPLIGLATAAALVVSLARALGAAQQLNIDLEQRVEEKRQELDTSYARTAILERDRAIAGERERMMRDMHDGTGGQLVSALAMVEGGDVPRDEVAEALREALTDLRLVIDSLEPGEPDLLALLAHARARLEPRLERHGLHFAWEVEDVPAPDRFGPEQSLHLMRIFQEAVTNVVKHARATTIAVRTGTARNAAGRDCAFIEVADDGCGLGGVQTGTAGRGLRNMHRRAEELGGELIVERIAQGTAVRLLLPLRNPS